MIGAVLGLLTALASAPGPHRAAVVIGVNRGFDGGRAALRFADDDAARWWEVLRPRVDHLELLTVLDAESQALFPEASAEARVPDRRGLDAALARAAAAARTARAEGRRTELFFVYVGHGRVHDGEGEVRLEDGALGRRALSRAVMEPDAHDRVHVIVDACNAYHLVHARGEVAVTHALDAAFERFVEAGDAEAHPRVGAVLATSGGGDTHEWARYQGGLFSHEVRSGLLGAADVDGDGRVTYPELAAFVAAANLRVPRLEGRPQVFVRAPPIELDAPLAEQPRDLAGVELPAELAGHLWLVDARGLRLAELHKAAGRRLRLALQTGGRLSLFGAEGRLGVIEAGVPARLGPPSPTGRARGDDGGPSGVFAVPFDDRFLAGYRAALPGPVSSLPLDAPGPGPAPLRIAGWVGVALTVVALAGAAWQADLAETRYEAYQASFDRAERDRLAGEVRAARGRALGLGIGGGALGLVSAGALGWDALR